MTRISQNEYNTSGQRVMRFDGQWTDADSDGIVDPEELSDTVTTNYYYTGSATRYTTNSSNWLTTENILDPGGKIVASARFDEYTGYYFYNYDMRGSTSAILQPDGFLIKGYEYDEFGNLEQSGDAGFLNEVTFTGSVSDTSTGLQYMNARYYNPSTGRFLSQDTYSGNPYDPWTQHLYSYCGNNPTSMIDPTGHFFYAVICGKYLQVDSLT